MQQRGREVQVVPDHHRDRNRLTQHPPETQCGSPGCQTPPKGPSPGRSFPSGSSPAPARPRVGSRGWHRTHPRLIAVMVGRIMIARIRPAASRLGPKTGPSNRGMNPRDWLRPWLSGRTKRDEGIQIPTARKRRWGRLPAAQPELPGVGPASAAPARPGKSRPQTDRYGDEQGDQRSHNRARKGRAPKVRG